GEVMGRILEAQKIWVNSKVMSLTGRKKGGKMFLCIYVFI
ncbi:hypothetical protein HKBW3S06_00726, partial [Candidatus Hakubella thermalkaliphila]